MSLLFSRLKHHWFLAAVVLTAAALLVDALWIPVKAEVAQILLTRSWQQNLAGNPGTKPWPWADTHAVAVLEIPRLGLRQIVLEGSSGRNLAFGPTLVNSTAIENTKDRILSGHRDTHFSFQENLQDGDLLRLVTSESSHDYRVRWMETVDVRQQQLVIEADVERLTLVTCYPFDAVTTGGPLRRIITAVPEIL